jgi:hypothetical protein
MHNDEEATHAKLTALLADSVTPAISEHGGRIVKNTGDGLFAEFPFSCLAVAEAYFPAALRNASLMRSCQPGPPSLKCSSTSWSMRSETCSFTPGTAFFFGGASATLAVAFLNAASASLRASLRVRGRLGWSAIFQIPSNSAVDR